MKKLCLLIVLLIFCGIWAFSFKNATQEVKQDISKTKIATETTTKQLIKSLEYETTTEAVKKEPEKQQFITVKQIKTKAKEATATEASKECLGIFTVTAYCPCKDCSDEYGWNTATGAVATAGRTIAVDPSVIPYGTKVLINGHTYIAEDCGGEIKGNRIDIFFNTHKEVESFDKQKLDVYIVREVETE